MSETKHLQKSFEDLYNGNPWLDVTLAGTLMSISAAQAAAKKSPECNSIWEIVNHLISWRLNVLERLSNLEIDTPQHNYFLPVADVSESAWQQTIQNLAESQKEWVDFLNKMPDTDLNNFYIPNRHKHFEHIHGIMQHDSYHLGQIVLLAKHSQ